MTNLYKSNIMMLRSECNLTLTDDTNCCIFLAAIAAVSLPGEDFQS